ncbi:hypothetical protein MNV49_007961 [Pseudohyphozyma bogoriensis]|nr:hypothetical protein MNV49_007961 [Pseudohyphozyma bogoriensis]
MPTPSPRTLFYRPTAQVSHDASDSQFRRFINKKHGLNLLDYKELQAWTTKDAESMNLFWEGIWEYGNVIGSYKPGHLFDSSVPMGTHNPNLINAQMNLAENLLLSHPLARSDAEALVSVREPDPSLKPGTPEYLSSTFLRSLTHKQLYNEVSMVATALRKLGLKRGDRVATFSPSNAEAVVLCLAATALGCVWSSCPSEFGVRATLERLTQIEPKVLLAADFYRYGGKTLPIYPKLNEILASLPTVETVIVVGQINLDRNPREPFPRDTKGKKWTSWNDLVKCGKEGDGRDIKFERGSAMDPVYILYSSGTTGKPKAIVHSVGGMILSSKMANMVHNGFGPQDALLQFSTLVHTMSSGVKILLYDGSPLSPHPGVLFALVENYKVTAIGISPRFIQTLENVKYIPNKAHDLSSLRMVAIAGSVLKAELYDWIRENLGHQVWINNGSGGTDICNLFVGGCPSEPVYHAELQVPGLGMQVESWDEDGKPSFDQQGEMVITKPFPNMPLGFWGDDDGSRYKAAYYEAFKQPVWTQGDWIEISSLTQGVTIFGRSDGVLNPAGVRFGSSELYAVVEEMKDVVEDCIAVGQKIMGGDERVVLFVKPKGGAALSDSVVKSIKSNIAHALSTRHVPSKIIHCPKVPYTGNGKRLEVATKKLVNGVPLEKINLSSAEDPECLKFFINHPELKLEEPKAKL